MNMIKNNFITKFKLYNDDIYYFFKYWYNKNKDESAYFKINYIIEKYHENQKIYEPIKFPYYVEEFLTEIKSEIKRLNRKNIDTKNF